MSAPKYGTWFQITVEVVEAEHDVVKLSVAIGNF